MKSTLTRLRNQLPVPYVPSSGGGSKLFGRGRGTDSTSSMESYSAVSTLFSVVSRIANATSQVGWGLYRPDPSGDPDLRTRVPVHPALELVNRPNKFMTRQELMESGQQYCDLTGESWNVVEYAPGTTLPVGLWPVRPDKMEPVPSRTNYLAGYMYHGPDGEDIPLGLNEVIFLRMPNPMDPYRGVGPVQSLLATLDSTRFSQAWNRNFFANSAEPGGVIEVPKELSDPEFDQLQRRWNETHQGVAKAHRVAILENMHWVPNAITQRDMQWVQLQQVSRDTIIEAFGLPRSVLGITEDVNRANAETGEVTFGRWLQVPRLERWKAALNNDLLPLYGPLGAGIEFDYDDPIPPDKEALNAALTAKTSAYSVLVTANVDPDAAAEVCGLPPMATRPVLTGGTAA